MTDKIKIPEGISLEKDVKLTKKSCLVHQLERIKCLSKYTPRMKLDSYGTTKVLVEIPNDSIESAKRISEEVNSYYKEQGADPDDWGTITQLDVLEKTFEDVDHRFYTSKWSVGFTYDYDDLVLRPDRVFNYFVCKYEQYIKDSTETKVA